MKKILFIFLCLCASQAWSATYYISYSTGSNSNNGTSKSTPWKSHPYMPSASGCSGSGSAPAYTHAAGDQFIFLGGDTWPVACWYMNPPLGGTPTSPDYYGVDKTWWNSGVCGASWCRPIFNENSQVPVGGALGGPSNRPQLFCPNCGTGGPSNFVLDNWEIINGYWDNTVSTGTNQIALIGGDYGDCNYTVENMYLHKWTHAPLSQANNPGDILELFTSRGAGCGGDAASGDQMLNNVMNNADGSCDSGQFGAAYRISGNFINCVPNIVVGDNWIYSGNIVNNMPNSYDDAATPGCVRCIHENGYEGWLDSNGTQYIYNNLWMNTASHGITVFLTPAFGVNGGATAGYFYNNVIWDSPNANPVYIDTDCGNGISCDISQMSMYLWGNTLDSTTNNTQCIRVVARSQPTINTVDLRNNHCISNNGTGTSGLVTFDSGISASNFVTTDNITMTETVANAAGYTTSNSYRPTSSAGPTVGQGTNLTSNCSGSLALLCMDASGVWNTTGTGYGTGNNVPRPSGGAWDVGAYQLSGGPPGPPPVTLLSKSLPLGTVGTAYSTTLAASGGTPPYAWSGSGFPSALSLSAGGVLSGTPTVAGTSPVSVNVSDSSTPKLTASGQFQLTINASAPPPTNPIGITVTETTSGSTMTVTGSWTDSAATTTSYNLFGGGSILKYGRGEPGTSNGMSYTGTIESPIFLCISDGQGNTSCSAPTP